jgi:hypothetical protein
MGTRNIGIGPTPELQLRVSVATLSRVIFPRPKDEVPMIAFEHKATLKSKDKESHIAVMAQPFGGAIRILELNRFQQIAGIFNFDSERSRSEQDFRIHIKPSKWEKVRDFCLQQMKLDSSSVLDLDPARELREEFEDALGIALEQYQFTTKPIKTVLEDHPIPTANMRALGYPTVRIYRIFEVQILDPNLCRLMMNNSNAHSVQVLQQLAQDEAHKGGRGRANAVLATPVEQAYSTLLATPYEKRSKPLKFEGTYLDRNVSAVLDGISVAEYEYL